MTERARLIEYFDEAVANGAPRYKVAQLMALSERTIKRWRERDRVVADRRPDTQPAPQPHQLTPEEEQAMLDSCNLSDFRSLPPSQIVPLLADRGTYIASESSFYRVLKKHRQLNHRGRSQPPRQMPEPTSFTATGPNQVYSWDISYYPSNVKGLFWYLYLILDVYSRKIVAWEVHDTESGEHARALVERALIREVCWDNPSVLHSDNGAPMASYTLKSGLAELGMAISYSRPRVSNDNPYSGPLFRTVKYCPNWPPKGFKSLEAVRQWMLRFEHAYNKQQLHSGINFVTPGAATVAKISTSWPTARWYTNRPNAIIRNAGPTKSETGKPPEPFPSIRASPRKLSGINAQLRTNFLDNYVENYRLYPQLNT